MYIQQKALEVSPRLGTALLSSWSIQKKKSTWRFELCGCPPETPIHTWPKHDRVIPCPYLRAICNGERNAKGVYNWQMSLTQLNIHMVNLILGFLWFIDSLSIAFSEAWMAKSLSILVEALYPCTSSCIFCDLLAVATSTSTCKNMATTVTSTAVEVVEKAAATLKLRPTNKDTEEQEYKYAHLLPHFSAEHYPPLSPFEHVDPGRRALSHANPRSFLDAATSVDEFTPRFGTEVTGINLAELDNTARDQLALEVNYLARPLL